MERVILSPHFQRYGFLAMLKEALADQRFRYLILSQIHDCDFSRYLLEASQEPESAIDLLHYKSIENQGVACGISTFSIQLV
jgi:hypothetical protein